MSHISGIRCSIGYIWISCKHRGQFKELAEEGERQIQRLEKGNLNIDKIEGVVQR
jgi:hypothetical protein